MRLKKVKVFVLIFLFTLAFAASLHTPKKTDAMWIGGTAIQMLCDECRGQYHACCRLQCYAQLPEKSTDSFNPEQFEICVNDCAIALATMCFLPF